MAQVCRKNVNYAFWQGTLVIHKVNVRKEKKAISDEEQEKLTCKPMKYFIYVYAYRKLTISISCTAYNV